MLAYTLRRCLIAIPTILGVMLLLFLLFFQASSPQSIARTVLGEKATEDTIQNWIKDKGYDKPKYFNSEQSGFQKVSDTLFCSYMVDMATFNFGKSDIDQQPIWVKLKMGVVPSLLVTIPIMFVSLIISVFISMLSAMFRKTYIDSAVVFACVIAMSIVYFLYIIAGQFIFAKVVKWFPVSGWSDNSIWYFLTLPIVIGIIANIGESTRFYRTIMIHEINSDYIRTARAKGLGDMAILVKHLLRNAMLPILTRIIMLLPYMFTGSLLLESFFSIPGLGRLMVDSIVNNDFSTLKAGVYLSAILYIIANIISDISYTIADPRVRLK
ncbi:MAG: ABC transporter permease [Lentisphaeraceae bacterium]|nr:ABC transporter permease [Lentisphaeraceae bacterium]